MISCLRGTIFQWLPPAVVLDVGGVGYELSVPLREPEKFSQIGSSLLVWTHMLIREDNHTLYGFLSQEERDSFRRLIRVSGIGAKTALACLSCLSSRDLSLVFNQEQVHVLSSVPGIGKKTAERLILELKHVWPRSEHDWALTPNGIPHEQGALSPQSVHQDVLSAMLQLGYKEKEIGPCLKKLSPSLNLGEAVRSVLRMLNPHVTDS